MKNAIRPVMLDRRRLLRKIWSKKIKPGKQNKIPKMLPGYIKCQINFFLLRIKTYKKLHRSHMIIKYSMLLD